MAIKMNEPVRKCTILTNGPVYALGGISGPIRTCKLTNNQIVNIMRSGHRVAEYNPNNPGERIELTLDNNGASPFEAKKPEPVTPPPAAIRTPKTTIGKPTAKVKVEPKVEIQIEKKPEPAPVKPVKEEPVPVVEETKPVEEVTPVQEPIQEETPIEEAKAEEVAPETEAPAEEKKKTIEIDVVKTNGGNHGGSKKSKRSSNKK